MTAPAATHHLAQVNIALPVAPLDCPALADFVAALAEVNALADAAPGFVWRLQTEDGNATAVFAPMGEASQALWRVPAGARPWPTPSGASPSCAATGRRSTPSPSAPRSPPRPVRRCATPLTGSVPPEPNPHPDRTRCAAQRTLNELDSATQSRSRAEAAPESTASVTRPIATTRSATRSGPNPL